MPTLLEGIRETHEGPEPRVLAEGVRLILQRAVGSGDNPAQSVASIADRAKVSTRTVYRVLQGDKRTISLKLADALVTKGVGGHLRNGCELVWDEDTPNERVVPY